MKTRSACSNFGSSYIGAQRWTSTWTVDRRDWSTQKRQNWNYTPDIFLLVQKEFQTMSDVNTRNEVVTILFVIDNK